MHAYLAIKFHADMSNREKIEGLSAALEDAGFDTTVIVRDYEEWGENLLDADKLMDLAFEELDAADLLVLDLTEKGVGLGIEAGYAYAKDIPIIVTAETGSHISTTLQGICEEVIFYDTPANIGEAIDAASP